MRECWWLGGESFGRGGVFGGGLRFRFGGILGGGGWSGAWRRWWCGIGG